MQAPRKLAQPKPTVKRSESKGENKIADLVAEMLHGATKIHFTHLKTTSFAAHCALGEFYEAIPSLADGIAECYQGATEQLLSFPTVDVEPILTPEDAVNYLRGLYEKVDAAQQECMYSEIGNDMDMIKSLIDKTKYKLLFLK